MVSFQGIYVSNPGNREIREDTHTTSLSVEHTVFIPPYYCATTWPSKYALYEASMSLGPEK